MSPPSRSRSVTPRGVGVEGRDGRPSDVVERARAARRCWARVKRGEVTVARAAGLAGVSLRQMRRLWARYSREGDAGLVHRSRGRASNNRIDQATREAVLG